MVCCGSPPGHSRPSAVVCCSGEYAPGGGWLPYFRPHEKTVKAQRRQAAPKYLSDVSGRRSIPAGTYPLGSLVAFPLSWMQGARHVLRCSFRFTRRMVKSGLVEPSEPVDRLNFLREFPTHPFRQGPLD